MTNLDHVHTTTWIGQELAFLTGAFDESIRDPLWKDIPLTAPLKHVAMSAPMQKLTRIKQLGPVFHLYPGAVHTRYNHSIGTYHVARLIVMALLKSWSNGGAVPLALSRRGILSFLCAAMLHDVGHFPYAHALKELALIDHERLGVDIILHDDELKHILTQHVGASVEMVCAIIDPDTPTADSETKFYRNILSGTLDPDKLDYLNRDAYFCGVPYGVQDVSYITSHVACTDGGRLALPLSAMGSVEHLLFSKYLMYRNVYWHKTTRAATAMAKKALNIALMDGTMSQDDLYGLDDYSLFSLVDADVGSATQLLLQAVHDNRLLEERYATAFNPSDSLMVKCLKLTSRMETERKLHEALCESYPWLTWESVVIDIPEDISFEASIPILLPDGTSSSFSVTDELFTADVVRAFSANLRKFRIFAPPEVPVSSISRALSYIREGSNNE